MAERAAERALLGCPLGYINSSMLGIYDSIPLAMKYSTIAFTALFASVFADELAPVAPTVNGAPFFAGPSFVPSETTTQPIPSTVNGAPFFAGPDFVGSETTTQPIPPTINSIPFFAGPSFVGSDSVNYNATVTGITVTGYTTYCPEATTVTITTCSEHKCAPTEITVTGPSTVTVSEECVVPSTVAAESTQPAVSTLVGAAPRNVAGGLLAAVAVAVVL